MTFLLLILLSGSVAALSPRVEKAAPLPDKSISKRKVIETLPGTRIPAF